MSVPAVTAPYIAAVALLAAAGVAKAVRPGDTARALRAAGFPAGRATVRAGAALELAVAVAATLIPGRLSPLLVAVSYAAFAMFVVAALRRGWALSSCGCFGRADSKPTYTHAALDAGASACAFAWLVGDQGSIRDVLSTDPLTGLWLSVVGAVVAGLAYALWTRPVEVGTP